MAHIEDVITAIVVWKISVKVNTPQAWVPFKISLARSMTSSV